MNRLIYIVLLLTFPCLIPSVSATWLSPDPLMDKYPQINPYAYAAWNPLKYVDPNGKWIETAWDIANLAMDITSLKSNIEDGNVSDAVVDGVGLILDVAATVFPIVPGGAGSAIKAYRVADNVNNLSNANRLRKNITRGIQNETKVLKEMGLDKNTIKFASQTKTGKSVNVIPDAIQDNIMYEIKDTKSIYNTKQIQGEMNAARETGRDFKIITGEKTHISSKIPADVEIIRRSDLGL